MNSSKIFRKLGKLVDNIEDMIKEKGFYKSGNFEIMVTGVYNKGYKMKIKEDCGCGFYLNIKPQKKEACIVGYRLPFMDEPSEKVAYSMFSAWADYVYEKNPEWILVNEEEYEKCKEDSLIFNMFNGKEVKL